MPDVQVEDQATRAIYVRLRHRAHTLRLLAVSFVGLIALTLGFGAIPYFLAGDMAVTETRAALEMRRVESERAKGVEKRDTSAGETAGDAASTEGAGTAAGVGGAAPALAQAQPAAAPAANAGPPTALGVGDEAFAAAVIRVTDVVLLIALVFIFGSLYRYSMRLASYYDEKADALRLLEAGDRHLEERLSQITRPLSPRSEKPARRNERV
jgi:hypothetical protein